MNLDSELLCFFFVLDYMSIKKWTQKVLRRKHNASNNTQKKPLNTLNTMQKFQNSQIGIEQNKKIQRAVRAKQEELNKIRKNQTENKNTKIENWLDEITENLFGFKNEDTYFNSEQKKLFYLDYTKADIKKYLTIVINNLSDDLLRTFCMKFVNKDKDMDIDKAVDYCFNYINDNINDIEAFLNKPLILTPIYDKEKNYIIYQSEPKNIKEAKQQINDFNFECKQLLEDQNNNIQRAKKFWIAKVINNLNANKIENIKKIVTSIGDAYIKSVNFEKIFNGLVLELNKYASCNPCKEFLEQQIQELEERIYDEKFSILTIINDEKIKYHVSYNYNIITEYEFNKFNKNK